MNSKKLGRPKSNESVKSFTVSIKPSEKLALELKFGSITKAIKTLL